MSERQDIGRVWLTFPPSVNNLFSQGIVRGKIRRFPSKKYKAWQKDTAARLMASRLKPISIPVVVKLELVPRDRRARDADNYAKPVLDCLVKAGILPGDDSRWVKAVVPYWLEPDAEACGVTVLIRTADGFGVPLTGNEAKALEKLRAEGGARFLGPGGTVWPSEQTLLEKGYLQLIPGLFPDAPQGIKIAS